VKFAFNRFEIDHHILKLTVGLIAITLANLTSFFSTSNIDSISASYHQGGMARDIFVGFLFAISAFLFAYNGYSPFEMLLAKLAAVSAIGVAIFPCSCGAYEVSLPYVHNASAAVMFLVLTFYCLIFYRRARGKGHRKADMRAVIYAICGFTILFSLAILVLDFLIGGSFSSKVPRLTFYGERSGLIAFGISWLVASRTLPFVTASQERVSVIPFTKT